MKKRSVQWSWYPVFHRMLPSILVLLAVFGSAGTLLAQGYDPARQPVYLVKEPRWTAQTLQPASKVSDESNWNFGHTPTASEPFFYDLDVENGWVFAATGRGLAVYDAVTDPAKPVRKGNFFASTSTVPVWHQNDTKFYLYGVDAPEGNDNLVAVAAISGNGMLLFNTSSKENPRLTYQDDAKDAKQVWAATYGNSSYAFLAAQGNKVLVYNMTAASGLSKCKDLSPASVPCQDTQGNKVYVGKINTQSSVEHLSGAGEYLAVAQGFLGVEIWKVSTPTSPQQVAKFELPGRGTAAGVALWKQGSKYYLAVIQLANDPPRYLRVYDVSCIATGGCTQGTLVSSYNMDHKAPTAMLHLSVSFAGSTPYVYAGSDDQFSGTPQREYLFDMTNPANPAEVTPKVDSRGYWGWYYYGNFTGDPVNSGGYNWIMPRHGKFSSRPDQSGYYYFYRAAYALFDVHKIPGSVNPTARFTAVPASDGKFYSNDPIAFQDNSVGNPTTFSWSFSPDGTSQESLTAPGTHHVTFATPGAKTVSLTVNPNTPSVHTFSDTLTLYDPMPVVGEVRPSNAAPRICQKLRFEGLGITGKPALTYSWKILGPDSDNPLPGAPGSSTTSLDWDTSASGILPGTYKVQLTATNTKGAGSNQAIIDLETPDALPPNGTYTPTHDPITGPTVTFHLTSAQAASASEWRWEFGDGSVREWSSDPIEGPNPRYTYKAVGTYKVKVSVRNCYATAGTTTSAELTVAIDKLADPQAAFSASCPLGFCSFGVGETIPFVDASKDADRWDYDWDGNGSFEDANRKSPVTSHSYAAVGKYRPRLQVWNGETASPVYQAQELNIVKTGPPPPVRITVGGPGTANVGQSITLEATPSNCTAVATGWSWQTDGGTVTGSSNTQSISVSWSSAGTKSVRATNSGCSTASSDTKSVVVGTTTTGALKANFTYSPTAILLNQAASFNGSSSTGSPATYVWNFGDGSPQASGAQVSHTFTQKGSYMVKLTVTKPGSCPPAPFCEDSTQQTIVVSGPTLAASFNSEICISELSFVVCSTERKKEVTFTDASVGNIVSRTWDFGDGETATGTTVTHTYQKSGTFPLTLTVSDGTTSATFSRNIIVNGGSPTEAMVLPWIAKTVDGALVQSSDFYLHNPGAAAIDVTLEFRRRGTPEDNPPKATRTIGANATLFVADVVKAMFGREDVTGFISVVVDEGDTQPVVSSFNTTFRDDGSEFGQTVPGFLLSNTGAASSSGNTQVQHLVGLSDNNDRFAYFGLSNPGEDPVTYRLRFFDEQGQEIGAASQPVTLSRYAAKQYQVKDIRTLFGVSDKDDYRVVVESDKGSSLFPYGANLRLGSNDPSFVSVATGAERVYLLGALSTPGANNSLWQSDLVIANTGNQVVITEITFTGVGAATNPTDKITETLQPGETRRLADVIGTKWNIRNAVGVLTIDSDAPGGLFPAVQGESYENTNPAKRYGQTLPSLTDKQAAGLTQGQYLVGLRQDDKYRTTFWMFNPGTQMGEYDVVYRALDGRELGRVANVTLAPGKLRQFNAGSHPVGSESSFTVQVIVKKGKVLAAAQVVNNRTNDPAYVQGETR